MLRLCVITLTLLALSSAHAAAPISMRLVDGQWQQVQDSGVDPRSLPVPELEKAEKALENKNQGYARQLLVPWLKQNLNHPQRDRALMMMARAYYIHGDRIRSFFYLDELMDTFPASPLFYDALKMQYQIADAYLRGYKNRFLYLPILGAQNEGIEMLYRVQQRSPGSPLAEQALLRTADWYFSDAQYDLAEDAYGSYLRMFPRSPEVPQIRLQRAYASLAQFRGTRYDATKMIDARTQLLDIGAAYPDLAEEHNIPALIEGIDRSFAAKLYRNADYQRRTHQPRAAVYMYRYLIKSYPDSPEAADAQKALDRMPQWALADPEPASATGIGPAETTETPETSDPLEVR